MTNAPLPLRHLLLALAVVAVWGTNFVVIRIGLDHLPPLLFHGPLRLRFRQRRRRHARGHRGPRRRQCRDGLGLWDRPCQPAAADRIRALLDADAEVRFTASGTAANAFALTCLAQPHEAVLAHEHAHICTDETGAPGFFGQGVGLIGLPGASGKIALPGWKLALAVPDVSYRQPAAALSLTNATEYGTVYSAGDLAA
jgi:hypothetical protein